MVGRVSLSFTVSKITVYAIIHNCPLCRAAGFRQAAEKFATRCARFGAPVNVTIHFAKGVAVLRRAIVRAIPCIFYFVFHIVPLVVLPPILANISKTFLLSSLYLCLHNGLSQTGIILKPRSTILHLQ